MWIRNEVWKRVRPEFSSAQVEALTGAMNSEPSALGIYFNVAAVPEWLADKIKSAVARIEVGA